MQAQSVKYGSTALNYSLDTFRGDVFGGITAAVVGLPVALAFGVASGMGAAAGLYGAIGVGLFAALFGGTRSQISGPTAPMTVAMAVIITEHASSMSEALVVVMLGGFLQILLGVLRIGRYVAYTPHVVISGFMSGIGLIVMLIQALPFIGAPAAPGGVVGTVRVLSEAVGDINYSAFAVAFVTLAVGVLWPRRLSKIVPGTLVALITGTLLSVLWFTEVPVIGIIPSGLPEIILVPPSADFLLRAIEPALILALLGSVDSLLTSLIADSLTGTRHRADQELVGQGIGNMVAGLMGGLPGAGATMGTVTNIRAGGATRLSGVVRAVILLGLLLGLGWVVEPIPHAVLAGILMKVGWDIVDWRMLTRIHRLRREHLFILLITLGLTVFVDLVTAVAIGLIVAGMAHARKLENLELDSVVSVPLLDRQFFTQEEESSGIDEFTARVGLVALRGSFTVASSKKLVGVISEDIKDHDVVIFDFSGATYIDDSAAMVVEQLMDVATSEDTSFIVMSLAGSVEDTLSALGIIQRVPEAHIVQTLDQAREVARKMLGM
ncbi:MAG: SulP family inorganic anion transporter [Gemmatimonadetes bacterium]|nr:SulP family inorganic anion transporter [Gemmatimonadota bacterium]MYG85179.1 SulP family inorganic anion transporter [Gemmatimonadota bacterium]MYJ91274.1 SulP family inorganic anion transporter [Gemmatimonadota bacterium]